MAGEAILLQAAVFLAALLQAASGIGFALVAGPAILIAMDGHGAVQVTMFLSFVICAALAPGLWPAADRSRLGGLALGSVLGLPLGLLIFQAVGIATLKLLALVAVMGMVALLLRPPQGGGQPATRVADMGTGLLSGAMNAALAMPGPSVAARLTALGLGKTTVRATVLCLMTASYAAALVLQAASVGVVEGAGPMALISLPATIGGILAGRVLARHIAEGAFRRIVTVTLALTALGLAVDLAARTI